VATRRSQTVPGIPVAFPRFWEFAFPREREHMDAREAAPLLNRSFGSRSRFRVPESLGIAIK